MTRPDIDGPLRIMTVIWLALMGGVVTFGVVAYGLIVSGSMGEATLDPSLLTMLAPALVVMMAGGLVLGRRLEAMIPRDAEPAEKAQRYQTARIVSLAMQEGPALAIIVLSMLAGATTWLIAGVAVGVAAMFIARPRRDDLEALLRR